VATYAIGDVQGCFATLMRLVERLPFDPERDRLWLAGDLVNRGPRSLDVLRWARAQGEHLTAVLGNHDLHLLARAEGLVPAKDGDTLDAVLAASDCDELLDWLRCRPLCHVEGDRVLVHAGLHPDWTLPAARAAAEQLELVFQGAKGERRELLAAIASGGGDPRAHAARVFTRIRLCTPAGELCPGSGPPDEAPAGCVPWFRAPGRRSAGATIVFAHWSALGLLREPTLLGLDTGCVWGRELSCVRLEDRRVFQEPYAD
jgi:bis(5'-nucleosyl)-tetraphosphatase (symmetrical)